MSAFHVSRRTLLAAGAAAVAAGAFPVPAAAQGRGRYTFRNVEIVGGGFVPGIIFNQVRARAGLRPH